MLNQEIQNLDLSKVAALQQKRTLAFVNHFVVTTVQFLNNFMKQCEHKLMLFERKLEKINAAMILLETRLSSIPEVNTSETSQLQDVKSDALVEDVETNEQMSNENENVSKEEKSKDMKISPEYERFVKMVQVGVPVDAVKLKITLEGLDPIVFEKIINK